MRTAYHHQLADLTVQLGEMCGLADEAMKRATAALLEADLDAAERVIREHERMMVMRARAEREAFALLALQQPVAGELRAVFSAINIIADIERMGALAVHVAKIARRSTRIGSCPTRSARVSRTWPRWQSRWATVPDRC